MFIRAGLRDLTVEIEVDRLFTVVGAIDAARRRNWEEQLSAARPYIVQILGGEEQADAFTADFLAYADRPESCTFTALYFVRGTAP